LEQVPVQVPVQEVALEPELALAMEPEN